MGGALARSPFQVTVNKAPRGAHDRNDKKKGASPCCNVIEVKLERLKMLFTPPAIKHSEAPFFYRSYCYIVYIVEVKYEIMSRNNPVFLDTYG